MLLKAAHLGRLLSIVRNYPTTRLIGRSPKGPNGEFAILSAKISDVHEASRWLENLINFERGSSYANARLDLGPIRRLLARLENPEASLSIIHVAGSKGKGSTCLLAEAILIAGGERVGTFTSPHLETWSERFRIDGLAINDDLLAEAVERIRPHVEALKDEDPKNAPTFFDATTATALLLFAQAQVSRVLLEVGLGGRLDSTNAVLPRVTCITQIELEHTEKLGNTLAEVASEKAGIIKPGVPCIMGPLAEEARSAVIGQANAVGAPLFRLGEDAQSEMLKPSEWGLYGIPDDAVQAFVYRESDGFEVAAGLGVRGRHQIDNASIAVAALRRLGCWSDAKLAEGARRGLVQASLPGRLELIARKPWILVDSAHTPKSAASVREVMDAIPARRRHLALSISRSKSSEAIVTELLRGVDAVWVTRADPKRSMEPAALASLASRIAPECEVNLLDDPSEAVFAARAGLGEDDLLCCTGSVYLAGIARRVLGKESGASPD
ncbi:MAG TPA: bifunctional folylpolyglutamate synthase/dihydrofolate synthase [Myxococcales bacterium]|nr:bifunctional folylpolyglutamate synthase/dihydrofolate synthase [Myxococcales bacterium]